MLSNRKKLVLVVLVTLVAIAAMTVAAVIVLHEKELEKIGVLPDLDSAVVSNAYECATVGADIFRSKGSAVDAAIAMMICEEIACPESAGMGGGFLMTYYRHETGLAEILDSREIAEQAVSQDMFVNQSNATAHGGLAVATPGALKGYWEMHQRYGLLPWRRLIEPSIELCYKGHIVNPYMAEALEETREVILGTPSLREVFVNPATGDVWKKGDRLIRPDFAETLKVIAEEGADALYSPKGSLLPKLMHDLRQFGSLITEDDFYSYEPRWLEPVSTTVRNNLTVISAALPGGGSILLHMLNVLDGYDDLHADDPLTWHRVVETFKHAYGIRTRLGDPPFVKDIEPIVQNLTSKAYADYIRQKIDDNRTFADYKYYGAQFSTPDTHGTAHISILAPNGDAIAVTSTINDYFGAQLRSPQTGIVLNGEMDDFSTPGVINIYGVPASPANYIAPGKRPLSSMSPTIVLDSMGNVRMIVGASGGTTITTATLQLILRHVFFGEDLNTLMSAPRLHHQLAPMEVEYETAMGKSIIDQLVARGHSVKILPYIGTSTAIVRDVNGTVSAAFDPRRPGSAEIVKGQL